MKYALAPAFSGLAQLMRQDLEQQNLALWENTLRKEVDRIAGLTAIDGTTIITDKQQVLTFGAKIKRADHSQVLDRMVLTEPIVGGKARVVNPAQTGGTRHLSAAQFVYDQRDAIALVASQDGRFTVFAWSPCEGMVHAHRVESLLL